MQRGDTMFPKRKKFSRSLVTATLKSIPSKHGVTKKHQARLRDDNTREENSTRKEKKRSALRAVLLRQGNLTPSKQKAVKKRPRLSFDIYKDPSTTTVRRTEQRKNSIVKQRTEPSSLQIENDCSVRRPQEELSLQGAPATKENISVRDNTTEGTESFCSLPTADSPSATRTAPTATVSTAPKGCLQRPSSKRFRQPRPGGKRSIQFKTRVSVRRYSDYLPTTSYVEDNDDPIMEEPGSAPRCAPLYKSFLDEDDSRLLFSEISEDSDSDDQLTQDDENLSVFPCSPSPVALTSLDNLEAQTETESIHSACESPNLSPTRLGVTAVDIFSSPATSPETMNSEIELSKLSEKQQSDLSTVKRNVGTVSIPRSPIKEQIIESSMQRNPSESPSTPASSMEAQFSPVVQGSSLVFSPVCSTGELTELSRSSSCIMEEDTCSDGQKTQEISRVKVDANHDENSDVETNAVELVDSTCEKAKESASQDQSSDEVVKRLRFSLLSLSDSIPMEAQEGEGHRFQDESRTSGDEEIPDYLENDDRHDSLLRAGFGNNSAVSTEVVSLKAVTQSPITSAQQTPLSLPSSEQFGEEDSEGSRQDQCSLVDECQDLLAEKCALQCFLDLRSSCTTIDPGSARRRRPVVEDMSSSDLAKCSLQGLGRPLEKSRQVDASATRIAEE